MSLWDGSVTVMFCTVFIYLLSLNYLFFLSVCYRFSDNCKSISSLGWEPQTLLSLVSTHSANHFAAELGF